MTTAGRTAAVARGTGHARNLLTRWVRMCIRGVPVHTHAAVHMHAGLCAPTVRAVHIRGRSRTAGVLLPGNRDALPSCQLA